MCARVARSFFLSSLETLQVKLLDPNITIQEFLRKAVEPPNEQVKGPLQHHSIISKRISASIVERLDACQFGTYSSSNCTDSKTAQVKIIFKDGVGWKIGDFMVVA